MKSFNIFIVMATLISLTACHETTETNQSVNDITYLSEKFSPTPQFKTHKVAAFVVPTDQAVMSFQVSGIIEDQLIKIGDQVTKGQPLFTVSNPSLEPQIAQFNSEIEAIEATLQQNQAEIIRFKDLKKTNAISQNELDRLTNQRDNLLASKKSLEAQLEQAESLFNETSIKAPFAGSIAEIYKEKGEVISPGEAVLVVGGVTSLEAPVYLPSFLHQELSLGQKLKIEYADHEIEGVIKEISLTANPNSQLFKVMLDVPIEHELKSGERVIVNIEESLGEYFRLPIESVIDDGINEPFVFLISENHITQNHIELIDIEGDEVIVKMPQQGEVEVVIAGQAKLSPQQFVGGS